LKEQCGGGGRDDCSIADGAVRRCPRRAAAARPLPDPAQARRGLPLRRDR
jgi:hypothetical protein